MDNKGRITGLFIGDGGVATGFARVVHSIIDNLPDDYDIHHLAINYKGDPYPADHKMYPAMLGGDLYGFGRLDSLVNNVDPDFIFILNDTWVLYKYLFRLREIDKPIVTYFPVDAKPLDREWVERLVELSHPYAYTEFGKSAITDYFPKADIGIVPHGLDTETFFPMNMTEARAYLNGVFPGDFVVLNANRNQPRKRIDLTIKGFAKFAEGKPDNVKLYCHMGEKDMGWSVIRLCKRYGIEKRLLLTSLELGPDSYVSDERLNYIYNAADVGLNTSMGEGWGLCVDPSTEILTDSGSVKMEDLSIGDRVLSHNGKFYDVLDKIGRVDTAYSVSGRGIPDVVVTKQHPFLTIKYMGQPSNTDYSEKDTKWLPLSEITVGDFIGVPIPDWKEPLPEYLDLAEFVSGDTIDYDSKHIWNKHGYSGLNRKFSISSLMKEFNTTKKVIENARKIISGEFIPADESTESNLVAKEILTKYGEDFELPQPNRVNRFIKIDSDFLEFLGWYLAEGSYSYNKVELSLHGNELQVAKRFKVYLRKAFNVYATAYRKETGNRSALDCCSSILGDFLTALCGSGANNKRLHNLLWKSATSLGPLLRGYFKGDGHKSSNGSWSVTTVSKQLAWQILYILRTNHIFATFNTYPQREAGNFPQYKVTVGGFEEKLFRKLIEVPLRESSRARRQYYVHTENYIFTQVRDIEKLGRQEVMDISVRDSHSFVGNGVILHNTTMEQAACHRAQIVPNSSAYKTIYPDDVMYKIPISYNYTYTDILTEGKVVSPDAVAKSLQVMYDGTTRQKYADKIYNFVTQDKFKWSEIGKQWDKIFKRVI